VSLDALKSNGVREAGHRLLSADAFSHHHPRQFVVNVQETMDRLVATEDTDGNYQITIEDGGPKVRV
jgi:alpha,alpha-trehalase